MNSLDDIYWGDYNNVAFRYLIHSPFDAAAPVQLKSAWRSMERCVERGLTRYIGVSNFAIGHLEAVLEVAKIKPVINQIEMHPYLQQPDLLAYLQNKGILFEGFAPLTSLKRFSQGSVNRVCDRLAAKYHVSDSAILLRWVIDQGATVVTTSGKRQRLEAYLREVFSFSLEVGEVDEIIRVCKGQHYRGFFAEEFQAMPTSNLSG
jgi:diketogulonate reductase-like aldo/keto reductase